MTIRFYRRGACWYADLPDYIAAGGSEADCLMVAGADRLLYDLAGAKQSITVDVSASERLPKQAIENTMLEGGCILRRKLDGLRAGGWAYYDVLLATWATMVQEVGLCPVAAFAFGGHPEYYILTIHKEAL